MSGRRHLGHERFARVTFRHAGPADRSHLVWLLLNASAARPALPFSAFPEYALVVRRFELPSGTVTFLFTEAFRPKETFNQARRCRWLLPGVQIRGLPPLAGTKLRGCRAVQRCEAGRATRARVRRLRHGLYRRRAWPSVRSLPDCRRQRKLEQRRVGRSASFHVAS